MNCSRNISYRSYRSWYGRFGERHASDPRFIPLCDEICKARCGFRMHVQTRFSVPQKGVSYTVPGKHYVQYAVCTMYSMQYRLVQVKRRKIIHRLKSTPFCGVRRCNFSRVCCEPLRRSDRTILFCFFSFLHDFSSVKIIREIWTSVAQIYSATKEKDPPPRRSGLGMNIFLLLCFLCFFFYHFYFPAYLVGGFYPQSSLLPLPPEDCIYFGVGFR